MEVTDETEEEMLLMDSALCELYRDTMDAPSIRVLQKLQSRMRSLRFNPVDEHDIGEVLQAIADQDVSSE